MLSRSKTDAPATTPRRLRRGVIALAIAAALPASYTTSQAAAYEYAEAAVDQIADASCVVDGKYYFPSGHTFTANVSGSGFIQSHKYRCGSNGTWDDVT